MARVVIADDEYLVRAGVRGILASDPRIEVVAEAEDGRQAVEVVRSHVPDVVLLDIQMPGLDGLRVAGELHRLAVPTRVMMLTTFSQDDYVARALSSGAAGFLLKSGDPQELLSAVHAVAGGAAYLSPAIVARLITRLGPERLARGMAARERVAGLSERERQVLALVGAGLANAEIARRLYVVEGTVKTYVRGIFQRLGVRNRVQAAILAYEAGLVDPER
ncbi:response regulator [Bailinhaonella thermotolerans]|uniref:DNA-binding response regulator n=1 Tax=Bailinhaonella thermotolerans TaxID=1070861 RepID=A0A3A4B415_9ACTN|nr:response regulator transcription factor [Bailinhaonella thermotolerans]RJL35300.1 DNA-binding response regulator [Bailinhaonella thermotolerans]